MSDYPFEDEDEVWLSDYDKAKIRTEIIEEYDYDNDYDEEQEYYNDSIILTVAYLLFGLGCTYSTIKVILYILKNISTLCTPSYIVDLVILFSFLYYSVLCAYNFYRSVSNR